MGKKKGGKEIVGRIQSMQRHGGPEHRPGEELSAHGFSALETLELLDKGLCLVSSLDPTPNAVHSE